MSDEIQAQYILNDWPGSSALSFQATCNEEEVAFYLVHRDQSRWVDKATLAFVWPLDHPLRLLCSLRTNHALEVVQGEEAKPERPLNKIAREPEGRVVLPFSFKQRKGAEKVLKIEVEGQLDITLIHAPTLDALPAAVAVTVGKCPSFAPPRARPRLDPLDLALRPRVLRKAKRDKNADEIVYEGFRDESRQALFEQNQQLIMRVNALTHELNTIYQHGWQAATLNQQLMNENARLQKKCTQLEKDLATEQTLVAYLTGQEHKYYPTL